MKVLIIGGSKHGKTAIADYLQHNYNLKQVDASQYAAWRFIFRAIWPIKKYKGPMDCWADRHSYYDLWRELIHAYGEAKLVREVMKESDIYTGIRRQDTFDAVKDEFDIILFINAHPRVPKDPALEIAYDNTCMDFVKNANELSEAKRDVDCAVRRWQFKEARRASN